MAKVFIGVDPHKLSATIEVVDRHETVLATGRFDTDRAGAEKGTVLARMATHPLRSDCLDTCDNCPTYSCPPWVCL